MSQCFKNSVYAIFPPWTDSKDIAKGCSLLATLKRDNQTNNRDGYFFVTIRIRDDAPTLNTIIVKFDALDDSSDAPRCNYTKLGKWVLEVWRSVSTYHPCVLLGVEFMPIAVWCRFHLGFLNITKKMSS